MKKMLCVFVLFALICSTSAQLKGGGVDIKPIGIDPVKIEPYTKTDITFKGENPDMNLQDAVSKYNPINFYIELKKTECIENHCYSIYTFKNGLKYDVSLSSIAYSFSDEVDNIGVSWEETVIGNEQTYDKRCMDECPTILIDKNGTKEESIDEKCIKSNCVVSKQTERKIWNDNIKDKVLTSGESVDIKIQGVITKNTDWIPCLKLTQDEYPNLEAKEIEIRMPEWEWWLVSSPSWLTGYSFRINITIPGSSFRSNITGFPYPARFNSTNLNFSKIDVNGFGVNFADATGNTTTPFERERHNGTQNVGEYWVLVNINTDYNSTLFFYGNDTGADQSNPSNVWDSNFIRVYHFADNRFLDSSKLKANCTMINPVYSQAGKVGNSMYINNATSGSRLGCSDVAIPSGAGARTESWWMNRSTGGGNDKHGPYWGVNRTTTDGVKYGVMTYENAGICADMIPAASGNIYYTNLPSAQYNNTWFYKTQTYNGTYLLTYVNEKLNSSNAKTYNFPGAGYRYEFGGLNYNDHNDIAQTPLMFDEWRASNISRSAGWLYAEYISSKSDLSSYSAEQNVPVLINPTIKSFTSNTSNTMSCSPVLLTMGVDNGTNILDQVWFTYNGTLGNITAAVNGTNNILWVDTCKVGNYSLKAYVNDTENNQNNTNGVWVNFMPQRPYFDSFVVNESSIEKYKPVLITGEITNGSYPLDQWWFNIDGTQANITTAVNGSNTFTLNTDNLLGIYTIQGYVNDTSSITNTTTGVSFTVYTIPALIQSFGTNVSISNDVLQGEPVEITVNLTNGTYPLDKWWYEQISPMCYQETATIGTSCGGLSNGSYWVNDIRWQLEFFDGDWQTYPIGSWDDYFWINYTKPNRALSSSLWTVKSYNDGEFRTDGLNYTITPDCWNASNDRLSFEVYSSYNNHISFYNCWNGTNWRQLGNGSNVVYEEGIWWDMGGILFSIVNASVGINTQVIDTSSLLGNYSLFGYVNDTQNNINSTGAIYFNVITTTTTTTTTTTLLPSIDSFTLNQSSVMQGEPLLALINITQKTNALEQLWITGNGIKKNISFAIDGQNDLLWQIDSGYGNFLVYAYVNDSESKTVRSNALYVYVSTTTTTSTTLPGSTTNNWLSQIYQRMDDLTGYFMKDTQNCQILIDNDMNFTSPEINDRNFKTTYIPTVNIPPGLYYSKVRCYRRGVYGYWSETRNFTHGNNNQIYLDWSIK
jgi:hypothetical protein